MATYNPLNDLNSYSYHHYLILVNSSEAVTQLQDPETFSRFSSGDLDIPGAKIIINPTKSVRYFISTIEWTSWLVSFQGAIGTEGKMKIVEPKGAHFMWELDKAFNELNCDIGTGQFIIKTVFVGEKNSGVGLSFDHSIEYINDVAPMSVIWVGINMEFSESGGEYSIDFVQSNYGAGLMPAVNNTGFQSSGSINLSPSGAPVTVAAALRRVEQRLNEIYEEQYEQFIGTVAKSDSTIDAGFFEKRKYVFEIPAELDQAEYTITVNPQLSASVDANGGILSVNMGTPVTTAISMVLQMSTMLSTEAIRKGYTYAVTSSIIQHPAGSEYRQEHVFSIVKSPTRDLNSPSIDDNPNVLEYDYLYTGKNIDVLSFDMKTSRGLVFFQTIVAKQTLREDRTERPVSENQSSSSSATQGGTRSTNMYSGSVQAGTLASHRDDTLEYQTYLQLQKEFLLTETQARVKIRGNPWLMHDAILTFNKINGSTESKIVDFYSTTRPTYAVINTKIPSYDDPSTYEPFWYDGRYRVLNVTNTFANGQFTQDLALIINASDDYLGVVANSPETENPIIKVPEPIVINGEPATEEARARAFLRLIRWCEGTDSELGYNMHFGNELFESYDDHPRRVIVKSGYQSSAAGAYQILQRTWDTVVLPRLGNDTDFSPVNQDRAGWALVQYRRAADLVRSGNIQQAIDKCKLEWASFPSSVYNQPRRSMEDCLRVFNDYLDQEMRGITTLQAPAGVIV